MMRCFFNFSTTSCRIHGHCFGCLFSFSLSRFLLRVYAQILVACIHRKKKHLDLHFSLYFTHRHFNSAQVAAPDCLHTWLDLFAHFRCCSNLILFTILTSFLIDLIHRPISSSIFFAVHRWNFHLSDFLSDFFRFFSHNCPCLGIWFLLCLSPFDCKYFFNLCFLFLTHLFAFFPRVCASLSFSLSVCLAFRV